MRILIVCILLLISLQSIEQKPTDIYYQTSEVHPLLVNYEADKGGLTRFYTITNSPERRERFKQFNQEYLQQLEKLDFDKMKTGSQVDYILFQRQGD